VSYPDPDDAPTAPLKRQVTRLLDLAPIPINNNNNNPTLIPTAVGGDNKYMTIATRLARTTLQLKKDQQAIDDVYAQAAVLREKVSEGAQASLNLGQLLHSLKHMKSRADQKNRAIYKMQDKMVELELSE